MFRRVVSILGAIAIANFAAFVIVALNIGGDAINGHETGGRYFLANHGQLTEVSHAVFFYSTCHAVSVFATHGAWFVSAIAYQRFGKSARGHAK